MDYLLKPITFNRFFKAVSKAREYQLLRHRKAGSSHDNETGRFFFIKCDHKYEKIFVRDILFVQALQNYVIIQTEKAKFMTLLPLKTVEENLDPSHFIQVHKSYIVSIPGIESIENNDLIIRTFRIPVSRNFKEQLMERVLKVNLLRK